MFAIEPQGVLAPLEHVGHFAAHGFVCVKQDTSIMFRCYWWLFCCLVAYCCSCLHLREYSLRSNTSGTSPPTAIGTYIYIYIHTYTYIF